MRDVDTSFTLDVYEYNYYEPDYQFIPKDAHVVLCTYHSIEQIPTILPEVFKNIYEITKNVKFVLIEPVGWQWSKQACDFHENLENKTESILNPKEFFKLIGKEFDPRWAASYSFVVDYNRNLKSVLDDLVAQKVLQVDAVILNEFGLNPRNPSTRIIGKFV